MERLRRSNIHFFVGNGMLTLASAVSQAEVGASAIFGVWRNGYLIVNGVDLSDHTREINLDTSVHELPANVHGDTVARVVPGLEDWTITVRLLQDFAAGIVDATLWDIYGFAQPVTGFSVEIGADAGRPVSSRNPRYSGNAILTVYSPMSGIHGSNLEAKATFRCASTLVRKTHLIVAEEEESPASITALQANGLSGVVRTFAAKS